MAAEPGTAPPTPEAQRSDERVIVNPVSGERIVVRESGRETDGRLFAFDLFLPPGAHVPAGHTHPRQEERFTVLEGRMRFRLGLRSIELGPGEAITIPSRTAHWFANAGPETAHARVEVRPALRMEEFFEATEAMGRAGHIPGTRLPRLRDLAHVMLEFREEVAVPYVPALVVAAVLGPLTRLPRGMPRRARSGRTG